ncbi:MAG: hypothetical protein L0211_21445 [Planctomycetaceae bacterium]|nr:hypothetical protein [Planctomycetaceae bacterium]
MRRWARALHWNPIHWGSALLLGAAIALGSQQASGQHADDGWRRTAHGWERAEVLSAHDAVQFENQFVFRRETDLPPARWDFHPGLLAAAQVALGLGALCAWRRMAKKPRC